MRVSTATSTVEKRLIRRFRPLPNITLADTSSAKEENLLEKAKLCLKASELT